MFFFDFDCTGNHSNSVKTLETFCYVHASYIYKKQILWENVVEISNSVRAILSNKQKAKHTLRITSYFLNVSGHTHIRCTHAIGGPLGDYFVR